MPEIEAETTERERKDFAVLIPLTRGKFAMVDLEDYTRVARFKWRAYRKDERCHWYARRIDHSTNGAMWMHRLILGLSPTDPRVDHRNRDGLDNRRTNLRLATPAQNAVNSAPRVTASIPYKGIRYVGVDGNPEVRSWGAQIKANGKYVWLGSFWSAIEAAKAYDDAAKRLYGEYAYLNFPGDTK